MILKQPHSQTKHFNHPDAVFHYNRLRKKKRGRGKREAAEKVLKKLIAYR